MLIRPYEKTDVDAIVALNAESVAVLSPMDTQSLMEMRALASILWVVEQQSKVVGFLIAFTEGDEYQSQNYRWFQDRLKKFLYIDRVVIAAEARSLGIGKEVYRQLQDWAPQHGLCWLAAEIDVEPENDGSLRFHAREGFVEVGRERLDNGKRVSYQIKNVCNQKD